MLPNQTGPNQPTMVGARVAGDGLAPGAQLSVFYLRVAAFADLFVGEVAELVEAVHVLAGGGGVEPDDDASVALVPALLPPTSL